MSKTMGFTQIQMRDIEEKQYILEIAEKQLLKQQRVKEMLKLNIDTSMPGSYPISASGQNSAVKINLRGKFDNELGTDMMQGQDDTNNLNSLQTTFMGQ